mgnify:CR=1 FL=1
MTHPIAGVFIEAARFCFPRPETDESSSADRRSPERGRGRSACLRPGPSDRGSANDGHYGPIAPRRATPWEPRSSERKRPPTEAASRSTVTRSTIILGRWRPITIHRRRCRRHRLPDVWILERGARWEPSHRFHDPSAASRIESTVHIGKAVRRNIRLRRRT